MSNHDHKYKLTYFLKAVPEGITKEELIERSKTEPGLGACDAVVILSVIYPSDGSLSLNTASLDGRTGNHVTDTELFKLWGMLAQRLSVSPTISPAARQVASVVHETIKQSVIAARKGSKKGSN